MTDDHHPDPQIPDSEDEFARLRKLLHSLPEVPAPDNFEQELLRKIQDVKKTRAAWWKRLLSGERMVLHIPPIAYGAAATVAVVFIGYYIITSRNVLETPPAPPPPSTEEVIPSSTATPSGATEPSREEKVYPPAPVENDVSSGGEEKAGGKKVLRIAPQPTPAAKPTEPKQLIEDTKEEPAYLFQSRGAYGLGMEDSLNQIDSLMLLDSLQNTRVRQQSKSKKKLPPDK